MRESPPRYRPGASAMCTRRTPSDPSRSAIVRATRRMRCQPWADGCRRSAASVSSLTPSASGVAMASSRLLSASALTETPLVSRDTSFSNRSAYTARAAATRTAISAVLDGEAGRARSAGLMAGTSKCRSMRSKSGAEILDW